MVLYEGMNPFIATKFVEMEALHYEPIVNKGCQNKIPGVLSISFRNKLADKFVKSIKKRFPQLPDDASLFVQ